MQPILARCDLRLHADRNPKVGLLRRSLADKAGRSHAEDRQRGAAEREGLAHDVRSAAEAPLPVRIAEDGMGRVGVPGGKYAAEARADPEELEVILCDETAAHLLQPAAREADGPTVERALGGSGGGQGPGVISQVFELFVREQRPLACRIAVPHAIVIGAAEDDELLRMADAR